MSLEKQGLGNKIVLVGDGGVGKTCLISRFITGHFESNPGSTNGASYASKTIDYPKLNKSLLLDIWDTAGQEKYRSLTKFFYKDALMVIMVYDITRRESYDNVKNYWYKEIQENGEKNVVLGIAGNKSDLYENEAVPDKEAREFAKSINAIFALTSAQNNSGVRKLFEDMGNRFLDHNFQQRVQDENKHDEKDTSQKKIILDKKDNTAQQNGEGKKKKKGRFC